MAISNTLSFVARLLRRNSEFYFCCIKTAFVRVWESGSGEGHMLLPWQTQTVFPACCCAEGSGLDIGGYERRLSIPIHLNTECWKSSWMNSVPGKSPESPHQLDWAKVWLAPFTCICALWFHDRFILPFRGHHAPMRQKRSVGHRAWHTHRGRRCTLTAGINTVF